MRRHDPFPIVLAGLALLAGGAAACFSDRPLVGAPPPGDGTPVAVRNFAYVPPTLTVTTGTAVTWTNEDDVPHTVTADDGSAFGSDIFGQGETFSLTAPVPGTYAYHCAVHPFMKAMLVVTTPP